MTNAEKRISMVACGVNELENTARIISLMWGGHYAKVLTY